MPPRLHVSSRWPQRIALPAALLLVMAGGVIAGCMAGDPAREADSASELGVPSERLVAVVCDVHHNHDGESGLHPAPLRWRAEG